MVLLYQEGAPAGLPVPMAYDSPSDSYIGEMPLDPVYPSKGILSITAYDQAWQPAHQLSGFSIASADPTTSLRITSDYGIAEVFFPTGALQTEAQVSLYPYALPAPLPEGLVLMQSPYQVDSDGVFSPDQFARLSIRPNTLDGFDLAQVQIYHWDPDLQQWVALESSLIEEEVQGSALIDQFGLYALLGVPTPFTLYLPRLIR